MQLVQKTWDEYLEFTIDHNSDFVITQGELKEKEEPSYPDPNPDVPQPDPDVPPVTPDHKPSTPNNNSSAGHTSSHSSGIVNYESEKPKASDKKAMEAYTFWQNAKVKIHKAKNGKVVKLFVPKDITYMPASVMETLRKDNVEVVIKWNGKTITIPAGKAQPRQKLKVYWTLTTLDKIYNAK